MTCLSAYHKSDTTQADIDFAEEEYGCLYSVVLNVGSKLCTHHMLSLATFIVSLHPGAGNNCRTYSINPDSVDMMP